MELQKKQRSTLVFVQVLMVLIGVALAVKDIPYSETLSDYMSDFFILPTVLAGLFRLGVRTYQYFGLLFAIGCPVGLLFAAVRVFEASQTWGNIVSIVLLILEVVLFVLDVRFLVKSRHNSDL